VKPCLNFLSLEVGHQRYLDSNSSYPVLLRPVAEVIRWHLQITEETIIGLQLINKMYQSKQYMDYYLVTELVIYRLRDFKSYKFM